jgi:dienelactone hydrolase
MKRFILAVHLLLAFFVSAAWAQAAQRVVDIPTRPGVMQRIVLLGPDHPKAAVVLFPGGHGGLQVSPDGRFQWGKNNFLVRTRETFAAQGLLVAVVDAPSDRQRPPYLAGFRQTPEHVADIKAVIAWLKRRAGVPVWLVGTSRGTQSAAYVTTQLAPADGGPDGLVLTSTILTDTKGRPVTGMDLDKIVVPVLVVHHRHDGCKHCAYGELPRLMDGLSASPRKELLSFDGGQDRGDPCEAMAHHGFNGIENDVVVKIARWITAR